MVSEGQGQTHQFLNEVVDHDCAGRVNLCIIKGPSSPTRVHDIDQNKIPKVGENIFKNRSLSIPACQRQQNKVITLAKSQLKKSDLDDQGQNRGRDLSSRPECPPWSRSSPPLASSPCDKPSPWPPLLTLESGCNALKALERSLRTPPRHSCVPCSIAECRWSGTRRQWSRRGCAGTSWSESCSNGPWRAPRWSWTWCSERRWLRWAGPPAEEFDILCKKIHKLPQFICIRKLTSCLQHSPLCSLVVLAMLHVLRLAFLLVPLAHLLKP